MGFQTPGTAIPARRTGKPGDLMAQGRHQGRDPKKQLDWNTIPRWLGILGLTFVILLVTLCAVLLIRAFLLD